ncbi:MAG: NADH-quinone oxidoreductase subunit NuoH, partial [Candidatus Limnocylindria bacterium]
STGQFLTYAGIVLLVIIALGFVFDRGREEPDEDYVSITGGGYPVPPLDLEIPKPPKRKTVRGRRRRPAMVSTAGAPGEAGEGTARESNDGDL